MTALLVMLLGVVHGQPAWAQSYAPGFIPNVVATASSIYSGGDRGVMKIVNNSGMTEDIFGSKTGVHDTNGGNGGNMYLNDNASITTATGGLAGTWIDFDLGSVRKLDEMWVWNFNQTSYSNRGYKEVYIKYRVNATDAWVTLGGDTNKFTLAKASAAAGQAATNLVGGSPISFGKVQVRYVRLQPAGGAGVGNYYTTNPPVATQWNFAGLSEVRFYEETTTPTPPMTSLSPTSIDYRYVQAGKTAQAKLLVSATSGTGSLTLTSASLADATRVSIASAPALPLTLNNGQKTSFTLLFYPQAVGVHQTTLTLKVNSGGTLITKVVPIKGAGVQFTPGFIPNVVTTASTVYTGRGPEKVTDNSGITEDLSAAGSKTATHSGSTSDVWLNASGTAVSGQWIQFDLGRVAMLDEMWIWNHSQSGFLERSLKECKIFYKVNAGDAWTQLGGGGKIFTLKQAPGGVTPATNQDPGGDPIDFGQVQARYVRLEIVSAWNTTTNFVGLSEVRFYEFINPVRSWALFN